MVLVCVLCAWEAAARTFVDPFLISMPSRVLKRFVELTVNGELLEQAFATLQATVFGLGLGTVVGIPLGLILARFSFLGRVFEPFILGLYSLPRIALGPLFIIWFGIGMLSKVMMAFSLVVFVILLNTYDGAKNVDKNQIELLRTMNASQFEITRRVVFPSVLPWIMSAIRISVGMALIGAVVGELIGSNSGLGHYVSKSAGVFDTTGVFTGLLALMLIAVALNEGVRVIDRRIFVWRPKVELAA